MKKILAFAGVIACIFFSAQQTKFSGNYSTTKLKELKKDVPANARHAFYIQYLKANTFEDMKTFFEYKSYDEQVLKDLTDTIFTNYGVTEIENYSNDLALQQLDKELELKTPSENFESLLVENLGIGPNVYFPYVSKDGNGEVSIFETLPGSIISYYYTNGTGPSTYINSYFINNGKVEPILVLPEDDETFVKKIDKYAKPGWRFEKRAGYDITKNMNNEYLISTQIYNNDESYLIEYKTKDFNTFVPLRIGTNKEKPVWKLIK